MSDSKSNAKEPAKPVFVDNYDLLLEKIKSHDLYQKEINSIADVMCDLQCDVLENQNKHTDLSDRFINSQIENEFKEKAIKKRLGDIEFEWAILTNRISEINDMLAALIVKFNKFLEESEAKFAKKQDSSEKINALDQRIEKLKTDQSLIVADLVNFKKETAPFSALRDRIDSVEKDMQSETKEIRYQVQLRLIGMEEKIEQNTKDSQRKISEIIEEPKNQIQKIEQIVESQNSEFQYYKSEMLKKINSVSFDAENASARSINADAQIKFLDKKIENLSLQLKKYELK